MRRWFKTGPWSELHQVRRWYKTDLGYQDVEPPGRCRRMPRVWLTCLHCRDYASRSIEDMLGHQKWCVKDAERDARLWGGGITS